MVKSRSPASTSAPSRKSTDWMAPATRERICTRSTASSLPEKSSHTVISRDLTSATVTGTAGMATVPPAAVAGLLTGRFMTRTAAETETATARLAPVRAQILLLDVIGLSLKALPETQRPEGLGY
jgi:hypothetical protein